MTPVIRIENLSKLYRIDHAAPRRGGGYRTIREDLARLAAAPWRRLTRAWGARANPNSDTTDDFWALKDVSFDVEPGQVVGIVGRNGAGKSTLLKILSRITPPTSGTITINGRVGSLLEVGTGFHPELTGRENIFMNGSILGMSRVEIRAKFDEIVDFSGVETFLDTPVKRYSSGMQVRLAFAVAAHLEPEILVIDEVLAVGDASFQKRCLGKMDAVAKSGRTILFVSHNMAAVESLCSHGAVLSSGELVFHGDQRQAISHYMNGVEKGSAQGRYCLPDDERDAISDNDLRITEAVVTSSGEFQPGGYPIGAPLEFRVKCRASAPVYSPILGIGIDNSLGQRITTLDSKFDPKHLPPETISGEFEFICTVGGLGLVPGEYTVKLAAKANGMAAEVLENAFSFNVNSSDYFGNGRQPGQGVLVVSQHWKIAK
ncbi:MAG TPA: ABC transporter ATP-binding protein [Planctomycetaceae bacterium]|nr:ABC transporter ATP-binding protein [Planctomycetaceae bacterium]